MMMRMIITMMTIHPHLTQSINQRKTLEKFESKYYYTNLGAKISIAFATPSCILLLIMLDFIGLSLAFKWTKV